MYDIVLEDRLRRFSFMRSVSVTSGSQCTNVYYIINSFELRTRATDTDDHTYKYDSVAAFYTTSCFSEQMALTLSSSYWRKPTSNNL